MCIPAHDAKAQKDGCLTIVEIGALMSELWALSSSRVLRRPFGDKYGDPIPMCSSILSLFRGFSGWEGVSKISFGQAKIAVKRHQNGIAVYNKKKVDADNDVHS
mmetsp:Transcript_22259/g.46895  ORF Transcript_22259/g.46895 Transcript_22259/m.46895 type:complete len:104 (+) Transcript_22259:3730-4041(+)